MVKIDMYKFNNGRLIIIKKKPTAAKNYYCDSKTGLFDESAI